MPPAKRGNPTTDPSILLKRRNDRQKANEKLQLRLDEQGIKKCEIENNLSFSNIPQVLLINQKNYYTEYLKKDDNYQIIRNMKEKMNKKIKKKNDDEDDDVETGIATENNENKNDTTTNAATNATTTTTTTTTTITTSSAADDNDEDENEKTLVIHPGSHDIKIGWAEDVDPIIIPNVIGHIRRDYEKTTKKKKVDRFDVTGLDPKRHLVEENEGDAEDEESYFVLDDNDTFQERKKPIISSYKERMKYYKRRILPNCHEACFNFNKKQQYEQPNLEDIGDDINNHDNLFIKASKWIEQSGSRDYVIGEEVFRLNNEEEWIIRSPFLFTSNNSNNNIIGELGFNEQDINYSSKEEILGDIEIILYHIMKEKFGIKKMNEFKKINVVLIIPSLYRKSYVESMIELLLNRFSFKNASFIQEGLSSSFGLGVSTGCIVDIGNNNIHICCVDDGIIIEDSRISLDYGICDVIRNWGKNLINQQFPLVDINFKKLKDWKLLENIFYEHVTFDDSKTGVIQVGNFTYYENNKKIRKYQFKCFDENILSAMGLFYPKIFIENNLDKGDTNDDKQSNRIVLNGLSPNKIINEPLFEDMSSKFTGYENEETTSLLQDLQCKGINISELELEELVRKLIELNETISNSGGTVGSGRRGKNDGLYDEDKDKDKDKDKDNKDAINNNNNRDKDKDKGNNDNNDNNDNNSNNMKIKKNKNINSNNNSDFDINNNKNTTVSMRRNMTPLDKAIVESITISGLNDQNRLQKLYGNICLVGGGAKIDGFEGILMDRLSIVRNDILGNSRLIDVMGLVRGWKTTVNENIDQKISSPTEEELKLKLKLTEEQISDIDTLLKTGENINLDVTGKSNVIDPSALSWKGGCVYARLKVAEELWISNKDWSVLGSRSLVYGSVFNY
jgi:actin-related protein 8